MKLENESDGEEDEQMKPSSRVYSRLSINYLINRSFPNILTKNTIKRNHFLSSPFILHPIDEVDSPVMAYENI